MDAFMQTKRWTRAEYERLADDGYFDQDYRVELLDGEIVTVTPQHGPHAWVIEALADLLRERLGPGFRIRSQLPLLLDPHSAPEPDIAVIAGDRRTAGVAHPNHAELVVEVAESTLGKDRLRKGPLYARSGIPEYWIVDLTSDTLEVCRDPGDQGYRSVERLARGQTVRPLAKPDITLPVSDMLPPT